MKHVSKIIVSGGGTGGHIYPAIAIANEFKRRFPNAAVLFVGARDRMEMQKVPQAGYDIEGLWISGIQRKISWSNVLFPLKLLSSLWKSNRILKNFDPDIVVGTGGFASGPLLKMATIAKVPTLIQEQNSYPGITNKWLAKNADKICVAYDHMDRFFPEEKIIKTGNPVRQDLLKVAGKREKALKYYGLNTRQKILLVLGGSLGARRINQLIEKELDFLGSLDLQILWQCGKLYYEEYKKYNDSNGVHVYQFLDQMDYAYAAADAIVSRAGAGSVSELCIVAKPVLFIPSPNVAEDHQTKNASAIVNAGGALMLNENELDTDFQHVTKNLVNDQEMRQRLSATIKTLALPDATKHIVDEVEVLIKKGKN